jgi:hypothetical protein
MGGGVKDRYFKQQLPEQRGRDGNKGNKIYMLICLHTCIYMLDIFFFQKAMDLVDIIKKIMDPVGHLGVHGPE